MLLRLDTNLDGISLSVTLGNRYLRIAFLCARVWPIMESNRYHRLPDTVHRSFRHPHNIFNRRAALHCHFEAKVHGVEPHLTIVDGRHIDVLPRQKPFGQ